MDTQVNENEHRPGDGEIFNKGVSVASTHNNIIDSDKLTSDLIKILVCPGCGLICPPPILLCFKGHGICSQCAKDLENCPKCQSEISDVRNEVAEQILEKLSFKCPNWKDGCGFVSIGGENLQEHLAECSYGQVVCAIGSGIGCGKAINLEDYSEHLIKSHNITGVESNQAIISMSTSISLGLGNWTFPPHYLKAFDHTFLCCLHASYNLLLMWVSIIGNPENAVKYAGSIALFHADKKFLQAKWSGPVHTVRATPKKVFESGYCLAVLPETFLQFADVSVVQTEVGKYKKIIQWKCHFEVFEQSEVENEENAVHIPMGETETQEIHEVSDKLNGKNEIIKEMAKNVKDNESDSSNNNLYDAPS